MTALKPPIVNGNRLSPQWRTTYKLSGVSDMVVEYGARYLFEGGQNKEIEQELTPESMLYLDQWIQENGDKLRD